MQTDLVSNPSYQGIYLNLDSSLDRRIFTEHHLRSQGILDYYKRFSAFDQPRGTSPNLKQSEIACLESQIQIVKDHAHLSKHLHLIEDDIILSPFHHQILEQFLQTYQDGWDILYTGIQVPLIRSQVDYLNKMHQDMRHNPSQITFFDMSDFMFVGAFSYIINKNAIAKLLDIYDHHDYTMPVDFILRDRVCFKKDLKALCAFPFIAAHQGHFDTTMKDRPFEFTYEFQYLFQRPFQLQANFADIADAMHHYARTIGFSMPPLSDVGFASITNALMQMGEFILKAPTLKGRHGEQQ